MVRRLVEQQQLAPHEQDARQLHPAPLTSRQCTDRKGEAIVSQPEARADAPDLGFGRVATVSSELVLGVAERAHVALGRIGVDLLPQLLDTTSRGVEAPTGEDVRERSPVDTGTASGRILGEIAERFGPQDHAVRGRSRTGEHLQH